MIQPCGCVSARIHTKCLDRWTNRPRLPAPIVASGDHESANTVDLRHARSDLQHERRHTHCGVCNRPLDLDLVEAARAAQTAHTDEQQRQVASDNNVAWAMDDRQHLPVDDQETPDDAQARRIAEAMEAARRRIHGEDSPQEATERSNGGANGSARASAAPRATTACGYCGEAVSIDTQLRDHFRVCTEQLRR